VRERYIKIDRYMEREIEGERDRVRGSERE